MDPTPRPRPPDLEFEPPRPAPVRLRGLDPVEHQRLVVNPFLAVLAALGWWRVTVRLIDGPFPPLFVLPIIGLAALPLLIQYHCLDCGRTGSYPRRARHACPGILARSTLAHAPTPRLPTAHAQLILWGWIIAPVALLLLVAG